MSDAARHITISTKLNNFYNFVERMIWCSSAEYHIGQFHAVVPHRPTEIFLVMTMLFRPEKSRDTRLRRDSAWIYPHDKSSMILYKQSSQ
jgi:hypothetical protein